MVKMLFEAPGKLSDTELLTSCFKSVLVAICW